MLMELKMLDGMVHFNVDGPLYENAWQSIRHLRELLDLPLDM